MGSQSSFESDAASQSELDEFFMEMQDTTVADILARHDSGYPSEISRIIIHGSHEAIDIPRLVLQNGQFEMPRYPQYSLLQSRLETFGLWSTQIKQTPSELAMAGFYYSGKADACVCFHCGLVIYRLEEDDNVLNNHLHYTELYKHPCDFLHRVKDVLQSKDPILLNQEKKATDGKNDMENEVLPPEEKDVHLCNVCLASKLEVVFQPCRHVSSCVNCAVNLKNCPICRCSVESFLRVYLP